MDDAYAGQPTFGQHLRSLRTARGLSLRALATLALSSKSHIHEFEVGQSMPTPETAALLDAALDAGGTLVALMAQQPGGQQRMASIARPGRMVWAENHPLLALPAALLWHAAHTSAALSAAAEDKRVAPTTLDHARDDLRRLTTDYVMTSEIPRILAEAMLLRDRLANMIDQHDDRELYVLMGGTCLLLASISHDAGEPEAGMMQARSAETYADLAKHPDLLGWVLCTKAMIDLWRHRPAEVLAHADRGEAVALSGSAGLRLKGLQVRALAQLNRKAEAATLVHWIEHAPPAARRPGSMADYGSMFSFPETRQLYYAAVSHAHLGNYSSVEQCVAALGHDERPSNRGPWPVSWALSRSYLALARLDHKGASGGPEAATQALTPVLALPEVQRISQLEQVVSDVERRLHAPTFHGNASAKALKEAIHEFHRPVKPAVTGL
jgi:transcriptional regulator with XRE-family HTH domain